MLKNFFAINWDCWCLFGSAVLVAVSFCFSLWGWPGVARTLPFVALALSYLAYAILFRDFERMVETACHLRRDLEVARNDKPLAGEPHAWN